MSNASIIDMGGYTIVFDTFNTPQAGKDLRTAALELLGPLPRIRRQASLPRNIRYRRPTGAGMRMAFFTVILSFCLAEPLTDH